MKQNSGTRAGVSRAGRILTTLLFAAAAGANAAPPKNGFDLQNALVPAAEILRGGPPKDGIPAIDAPRFVAADAADFLRDDDVVIGLEINGEFRAYPLKILNWHEVVNDEIGGEFVAVTYCPLCGSGAVFDRKIGGEILTFGVSGLLYKSDVLLYDRQTESLWSQLKTQAVTGAQKGRMLTLLPASHDTWGAWRRAHKNTAALAPPQNPARNYARDPYAGYAQSAAVYFPAAADSPAPPADKYHPKEPVLGVRAGGGMKAYPFSELAAAAKFLRGDNGGGDVDIERNEVVIDDSINGAPVRIRFRWDGGDVAAGAARAEDEAGAPLWQIRAFWFAWRAFYPRAPLYAAGN